MATWRLKPPQMRHSLSENKSITQIWSYKSTTFSRHLFSVCFELEGQSIRGSRHCKYTLWTVKGDKKLSTAGYFTWRQFRSYLLELSRLGTWLRFYLYWACSDKLANELPHWPWLHWFYPVSCLLQLGSYSCSLDHQFYQLWQHCTRWSSCWDQGTRRHR